MRRKTYITVWIRNKENLNFLQTVYIRYKRFITNNPFFGGGGKCSTGKFLKSRFHRSTCGHGDWSPPFFGFYLNSIVPRGDRVCPPYTDVPIKF